MIEITHIRTIFAGRQYYHLGIYLLHRVAIVTDGDHGVGLHTAMKLAQRGAHVYLTCADRQSGERAREEVVRRTRNRNVFARELDMRSLASVRAFVKGFLAEQTQLNILVNNAECFMANELRTTVDGFEQQLAINHLAPFLLTNLLLETMRNTQHSRRIIMRSSSLHGWADWQPAENKRLTTANLQFSPLTYSRLTAYARSKLAANLVTLLLAERLIRPTGADGGITVNAVNPGFQRSAAMRRCMGALGYWLVWFFLKTEHSAAQSALFVALDPRFKTETGRYVSDCRVIDGERRDGRLSEASRDRGLAEWLWAESERMVGLETGAKDAAVDAVEAVAERSESTKC